MFDTFFLLALANPVNSINWHLLPMALVISLVYSASRYEMTDVILKRTLKLFTTIMIFMGGVFLFLWILSNNL